LHQLTNGVFIGQGAAYIDLVHKQIKPEKGFKEVTESSKEKITVHEDNTRERYIQNNMPTLYNS
jgi:hypothetical protein